HSTTLSLYSFLHDALPIFLPIINKPAIHLIIEEFIDSGIKQIILITGENAEPLRRTYDPSTTPARGTYSAVDEFLDKLSDVEIVDRKSTRLNSSHVSISYA